MCKIFLIYLFPIRRVYHLFLSVYPRIQAEFRNYFHVRYLKNVMTHYSLNRIMFSLFQDLFLKKNVRRLLKLAESSGHYHE